MSAVQTEVQMLEVVKIGEEVYISSKCNWIEMFSIVHNLVQALADNSEGKATYNDILDDLKEVSLGADM